MKEYRSEHKIYAVDFDGTLSFGEWPNVGPANVELITFLKEKQNQGDKLILWTCREEEALQRAVLWCEQQGLIFDAVNDKRGQRDREQGIEDLFEGNIGQRQHQHDKVGDEIGERQSAACQLVQDQRDRIVAARCAALAHDQSHAAADEQRTDERGNERHGGQIGQQIADPLKNVVKQGKAEAGNDGVFQKIFAEQFESREIADDVDADLGNAGRDAEPVVEQQCHAEDAALGDLALRVHVEKPESKDRRTAEQ